MDTQEIVERIMSHHWDMVACRCWICIEGRKLGLASNSAYLPHNDNSYARVPMPEWVKP